ncbi:hypothetical protein L6R46_14345 [Myxococcota bacterium]|nr:hypothetical protein [Myxococcota bacterium]
MAVSSSELRQFTPRRLGVAGRLVLLPLVMGGCAVGTNAPPSPGSPAAEAVEALPELIAASEATARAAAEAEGVAARLRAGELSEAEAQAELERLTAEAEAETARARAALEAVKAPLRRGDGAAIPVRP